MSHASMLTVKMWMEATSVTVYTDFNRAIQLTSHHLVVTTIIETVVIVKINDKIA